MKKFIVPALLISMTSVSILTGCQHTVTGERTTFDSIVVDKQERLIMNDSLSPMCQFHINLKYATPNDSINQQINENIIQLAFEYKNLQPQTAVDSFTNYYLNKYHEELTPYYTEDKQKGEVGGWYNYQYELNSNIVAAQDSVWGYQLERITYEGGAHGSHTITYINYHKATGRQLTLEDVFGTDYEKPLSQVLLTALQDKLQMHSLDELHDNGFLTWTDMYPSKNFLLAPEGIKFYYNAYEIAPYAVGPTELILSYETLKDLLKH